MTTLLILICLSLTVMGYGLYTAPHMDEYGRITKPGKKLTSLFK